MVPASATTKSSAGTKHGSAELCAGIVQEGLSAVTFGVINDSSFTVRTTVKDNPFCDAPDYENEQNE